jgi:hypothetical protein
MSLETGAILSATVVCLFGVGMTDFLFGLEARTIRIHTKAV